MKKYLFALLSLPLLMFASEEEDFAALKDSYQNKDWNKVIIQTSEMLQNHPESVFAKETYYFRALAYFHKDDPDLANRNLSTFLEMEGSSRYFKEALNYKYFIAEKFENGYYGHLFGVSALPRLESMWDTAYQLYDEVAMTLPRSDIAAKATFRKAGMLRQDGQFEESIEAYTALIRRFPTLPLAQESYIEIAKVYKKQVKDDYLDVKCYKFALINQKRFLSAYPSSNLKVQMEEIVLDIIDLFAEDVYKSALYFEKKDNVTSAVMYLKSLVSQYPKSKFAVLASQKIAAFELESIQKVDLEEASLLIGSE
ncbi:MAG: Cell division coordinator CpoB [Chlamydiia bacterium]|nr:Cell division coordinator CpoB [Chlamydiia bacterium]MCH9618426.1 Cell division coordinator CpoB [Chlamydiia bacterium]MCH9623752.1 Cell division coordinator CpoB [Chlamydiia bacterium]